jgi:hypothetical protein
MVGVQHAVTSRISAYANWFRRAYQNKRVIDNLERDFSDYRAIDVVSPYNGEVFQVYDLISATELSKVDQVIRNASYTEVYNGFEWGADVRLPGGGRVFTNIGTQRIITNDCDQPDDPNLLRFCDRGNIPAPYKSVPFLTDFKLAGSIPVKWGIQVSGTFISVGDKGKFLNNGYGIGPQYDITRTTRYTAAQCAGRPCTAGALVVPGMITSSIPGPISGGVFLAPQGSEIFLPRLNQLDLGFKKVFRHRGISYEPRLDIFNVLNADTAVTYRSTTFGTPAYLLPGSTSTLAGSAGILVARMPRISLQMRW